MKALKNKKVKGDYQYIYEEFRITDEKENGTESDVYYKVINIK